MATKAVRADTSAAARQSRKDARIRYKGKKAHVLRKARTDRKLLTPKERHVLNAHEVYRKAKQHGATEAEAKKLERQYLTRQRNKHALHEKHGKLTDRRKAASNEQRSTREKIKSHVEAEKKRHGAALAKIAKLKKKPEEKAKMKVAEKKAHGAALVKIAAERKAATVAHKKVMENLKKVGLKLRRPTLKDGIANFKEKSIHSTTGKTFREEKNPAAKTAAKKAAPAKKTAAKTAAAPAAEKAAPAKRGRAPKQPPYSGRGRKSAAVTAWEKATGKKAVGNKTAAEAPATKAAPKAATKAAPKAKPAAKTAAKKAAPAKKAAAKDAPHGLKKDGTPAAKRGRKPKAETAAAPVKKAATKPAAKTAAKPAAKTTKKAATKPAAKTGGARRKSNLTSRMA